MNPTELKNKNIKELVALAASLQIEGYSSMRKQELIFAVLQAQVGAVKSAAVPQDHRKRLFGGAGDVAEAVFLPAHAAQTRGSSDKEGQQLVLKLQGADDNDPPVSFVPGHDGLAHGGHRFAVYGRRDVLGGVLQDLVHVVAAARYQPAACPSLRDSEAP